MYISILLALLIGRRNNKLVLRSMHVQNSWKNQITAMKLMIVVRRRDFVQFSLYLIDSAIVVTFLNRLGYIRSSELAIYS